MNKILLFSDLHIHAHKRSQARLKDCLDVLDWVFEITRKYKIKDIIFAGDLFQDRQKIDVTTYSLTFDVLFKNCNGDFNLWLLLGNHDLWHRDKWDISSVLPFSALPKVTVINKACTMEVGGHMIDFLPYTDDPIGYLKELKKNGHKILVGHLAIHGAELNTVYHTSSDVIIEHDGDMVKIGPELFKAWDKVFLGHYHGAQKIDNIEYIGSPLELTFGEAFQEKHLIIYDLKDSSQEYIINDFSPKHIIATDDNIDKLEVKNNFVRLSVTNPQSIELLELKKDIQSKSPNTLEIISKPKKEQKQVVEDAKSILQREDEMLETYANEVDTGNLDKLKLVTIGKKICNKSVSN